jgi:heat shock protein HslJ
MRNTILIVCSFLLFVACKTQETIGFQKASQPLESTYWKLWQLDGTDYKSETSQPVHVQLNSDGRFTGYAGCNMIWGIWKFQGQEIQFSNINRTKTACNELANEEIILEHLQKAKAYMISGSHLILISNDGHALLNFVASTKQP